MRRLFLHIGAHKTGTTALQQSLHHNRPALLARGIDFVSAPTEAHLHTYLGPDGFGRLLPDGFSVTNPEGLAGRLALAQADTVVTSSENFSFFWQKSAIAALAQLLYRQFDEVRIVSYIRRQDRHAASHHREGARPDRDMEGELWGHATTALPAHNPAQGWYLDYDRRLGMWADVFGDTNMIFRVYDRNTLQNNDIFADFLSSVGLERADLVSVGDNNVSLGALQARVGHLLNGANLPPAIAEAILARLPTQGRPQLSRIEATAFLDRYRDSNRRLNQRFAIAADPDLFDGDMSDYSEKINNGWENGQVTQTLRAFLLEMTTVQPALRSLTADDLRLAAASLQASNPDSARRLIEAATALRTADPAQPPSSPSSAP